MMFSKTTVCMLCVLVFAVSGDSEEEESTNSYSRLNDEEKVDVIIRHVVNRYCEGDSGFSEITQSMETRQLVLGVLQSRNTSCASTADANPTAAPSAVLSGPCVSPNTVNLTDWWRKDIGSNLRPNGGLWACDRTLQNGETWFRFTGNAGQQLSDSCRPSFSCGGHGGFWSDAEMPTDVGEVRNVPIYGSWGSSCKRYIWPLANPMTVQRCSERAGDLIYKVKGTESCFWTFCGMTVVEDN